MIDTRLAPYAALGLRVALGLMFIAHAYLKIAIFTPAGFAGFLGQVGLPSFLAGRSSWPNSSAASRSSSASTAAMSRCCCCRSCSAHSSSTLPMAGSSMREWRLGYPAFLALTALAHGLLGDGALALKSARLPALGTPAAA